MNFAGNILKPSGKENFKKEQGAVVPYSFLKREIVILAKAKKGGNEVNEFKRKISSE
jgi:aromatic ring-opening dioxygenase LigB subunit